MINLETTDDQARGIYKILSKHGYSIDPIEVSRRIAILHNGLVHEDEFLYVLGWSGRVKIAHKLDQTTVPPRAGLEYGIPDVFMVVEQQNVPQSYYVEIKTTQANELVWPKKYYQSLLKYSQQTGTPMLVAWKWKSFDIWTLNRLEDFTQSTPSAKFRLSFERAHKCNLMSPILGDYSITVPDDFGLVIKQRKIKKIENGWETLVEDVYMSGRDGNHLAINNELLAVLYSLGIEEIVEETVDYIFLKLMVAKNKSLFAQTMPIRLNERLSNKQVHWQKLISEGSFPVDYGSLFASLESALYTGGFVIIFTKPNYDE